MHLEYETRLPEMAKENRAIFSEIGLMTPAVTWSGVTWRDKRSEKEKGLSAWL
jgi:hypothetical protein